MNELTFSKTGTLLSYTKNKREIIYPYHENGEQRGGAFWCIPNFDESGRLFTSRHGEYRRTDSRGDEKSLTTKRLSGTWGSLQVDTVWKSDETTLESSVELFSLSDETIIRPGFHPYFVIKGKQEECFLTINNVVISLGEITEEVKNIYPAQEEKKDLPISASLQTKEGTIRICFEALTSNETIHLDYAFCVWTDDKENYVCIETVVGIQYGEDGLPLPFVLTNNETFSMKMTLFF